MNNSFATAALALAIGAAAISPAYAQTGAPAGRMMGMAGGGCPMMGMMGERLMGQVMMGQGKMQDKEMQMGAMADSRLTNLSTRWRSTRPPKPRSKASATASSSTHRFAGKLGPRPRAPTASSTTTLH